MVKRKSSKLTKKDLEGKIIKLEKKLSKIITQIEQKPAEQKPAEQKPAEQKPAEQKPAEQKPAKTETELPVTFQAALEDAYYTVPMSEFSQYKAKVTGYSPAPNRYFVRRTAPIGKVPTSNWNDQKAKVTSYTQPSNQYFATRARMAYHPPDKTFGSFSGVNMSVEDVEIQTKQVPPPPKEEIQPEVDQKPAEQTITEKSGKKMTKEIVDSIVGKNLEVLYYGDTISGTLDSVHHIDDKIFLRLNTKKGSIGISISDIKKWKMIPSME